jgi:hypothetical protein
MKKLETSITPCENLKLHTLFLGAFAKLRKATIIFVASVRPSVYLSDCLYACPFTQNSSALTGRIFTIFGIGRFFENLPRIFKFNKN